MWQDYEKLRRLPESISGCVHGPSVKYQIRCVNRNDGSVIECSTEPLTPKKYPHEIYMIPAGEIDICDKGEFGGFLAVGGKTICSGNFNAIFDYNGAKYVIDELRHFWSAHFRLIKINDDGSIVVVYDADECKDIHDKYYESLSKMSDKSFDKYMQRHPTQREIDEYRLSTAYEIGFDGYYIGNNMDGEEVVYFLCSGYIFDYNNEVSDPAYRNNKSYLLIYNSNATSNQLSKIDLPDELAGCYMVTSIWSDSLTLVIGCDSEVVFVNLLTMEVEYRTGIDENIVSAALKRKHEWRK